MAGAIALSDVLSDVLSGEDQSDHIDVELRQAFAPRGRQRMVVMLKRWDRYMVGEQVQLPEETAAELLSRGGCRYAGDGETVTAVAAVEEPLVGLRFMGRYGILMPGDEAAFPREQAELILKLTYRDERREVHPLAMACPLPPSATAPSPLTVQTRRGHGGKDPDLGSDSNQGA